MARSEIGGDHSDPETQAEDTQIDAEAQALEAASAGAPEADRPSRRFRGSPVTAAERDRMISEARNVKFPVALRGYERAAVDRYVEEVNRTLAELEISSSPESAVRHALDQVGEETRDILQRAHQTAEEITARSRAKADDRLQQGEREAQQLRDEAQREAEETREAAAREAHQLREGAAREAHQLRDNAQREAGQLRGEAQHEATELTEAAAREAAQLRGEAQRDATELTETAAREATQLREDAAHDSQQARASAQREADDIRGSARRDADEMLQAAEARVTELTRSAETIWRERRRLIEDVKAIGEQLVAIGEVEGKRFTRPIEEVPHGAVQVEEAAAPADSDGQGPQETLQA